MNLHAFKIRSEFCKQFRPRLDTTELLINTRGESTMGAKRLVGAKRPGGKRLGGETTRGGNGLGAKRPGFLFNESPASSRIIELTSDVNNNNGMVYWRPL